MGRKGFFCGEDAKMTTCKCPICEKLHEIELFWTGNGLPRIYCANCKRNLSPHINYKKKVKQMPRKTIPKRKIKGTKKKTKIIRAIDPGNIESAYVDWNGSKVLEFGKIKNDNIFKLDHSKIDILHIEMVASYGMAVGQNVFETVFWIGRFWQYYTSKNIKCCKNYRKKIVTHICGAAKANDSNVMTAIIDRIDPKRVYGKYGKGTSKNPGPFFGFKKDIWQALALAIYAYEIN